MKKAPTERLLNPELDHHLDGEAATGRPNCRNGYGQKTGLMDVGRVRLDIPRDRSGTFDPQLIARYRWRFSEGWYREQMPPLKAAFEDGTLTLPADREIHDDIVP